MKKPRQGGGYKGKGFNGRSRTRVEGPRAAQREKEKPANPFERKPASKKHDVLGRVRGQKAAAKSVAVARSEAWAERKRTLGIAARQEGKSNAFVDRRFGEQEEGVSEEDKMLMRFQRERMARVKKGAFNIDDEEEDILTHKGMSIGAMTKIDMDDFSSDEDTGVSAADTKQFNFGGGFVQAFDDEEEATAERRKTKKEVMEEIIAKSKLYKAQRRKEKHEDEYILDDLNSKFDDLSGLLAQHRRPTNADKKAERDVRHATDGEDAEGDTAEHGLSKKQLRQKRKAEEMEERLEVDEYDKLAADLATDMKARAADRLKSAEELAKEEHDRLVAAEKARVRRMRGEVDSDDEAGEDVGGGGGYKKRRVRFSFDSENSAVEGSGNKESGDALGDDFVPDAPGAKSRVRKIKGAVAGVLKGKRKGTDEDDDEDEDGDEDGDEEEEVEVDGEESIDGEISDEEGEEGSEEGESGEEESEDDGEMDGENESSAEEGAEGDTDKEDAEDMAALTAEEDGEHPEAGNARIRAKMSTVRARVPHRMVSDEELSKRAKAAAEEVPYTFTMPKDTSALGEMLTGHSVANQKLILERLVTCHSLALDAQNKPKLEHLYTLLMQRVQALAPADKRGATLDHDSLDAAASALYMLTHQMPAVAKAEWKAFLLGLQDDVAAGFQSSEGPQWPTGGEVLLLSTLPCLFPCSDFAHPVTTPYMLTLAQHLSCCPVRTVGEAAKSLVLVSLLVSAAAEGGRLVPEAVTSISALLAAAIPPKDLQDLPCAHPARAAIEQWRLFARGAQLDSPLVGHERGSESQDDVPVSLEEALEGKVEGGSRRVLISGLKMAAAVVRGAQISGNERVEHATMKASGSVEAIDLMLMPLRQVLQVLARVLGAGPAMKPGKKSGKQGSTGVRGDDALLKGVREVQEELEKVAVKAQDAATAGYAPLTLYAVAPVAIAQHNPRFDDDFNPEHNMDLDRERAERAKLKRQKHKEFKGAVRELRKDNQFLEAERDQLLKKQRALRDERAKSIETFLTQQQFEAKLGAGKKNAKGRKRK